MKTKILTITGFANSLHQLTTIQKELVGGIMLPLGVSWMMYCIISPITLILNKTKHIIDACISAHAQSGFVNNNYYE